MKINIQMLKKIKLTSLLLDVSVITFLILDRNSGFFLNFLIKALIVSSAVILHSIYEKDPKENYIFFERENTYLKCILIGYAILLFILK